MPVGPLQEPAPKESPPKDDEAIEMAELFVKVVDEDGEPVFKASVLLNILPEDREAARKNGNTFLSMPSVGTDPDGEAVLELKPGKARTLSIYARSLAGVRKEVEIPALKPGESRELEVRLITKDDAVFRGRVVDDATGQPVADVDIQEKPMNGMFSGDPVSLIRSRNPVLTSSEDGTFEVAAATWRSKSVTLIAPGYAPVRCIVGGADEFPGQVEPFEVRLKRGATLRVNLESAPADARVKVTFYNSSLDEPGATIPGRDSLGSFQILGRVDSAPGAEPMSFVVNDIPINGPATTVITLGRKTLMERSFTPGEAGMSLSQSFDLSSDGSITGVLLTADGEPVPDYELVAAATSSLGGLIRSHEEIAQTVRTEADGSFSFNGLTARKYKVGIQMEYRPPVNSMIVATQVVDLRAGVGKVEPLEMTLIQGMSIRGRLVGPHGEATSGHVSVLSKGYGWSAQGGTKGEDGSFEVGPLVPGSYSINAMSPGDQYASARPVEAVAGATDLVIAVREAGGVTGRIIDAKTGEPLRGRAFYIESPGAGRMTQGSMDPKSDFEFKKIAAGSGLLVAEVKGVGFSPVTPVTIRAGEITADVVLKVSPSATVAATRGSRENISHAKVDVDGYLAWGVFNEESQRAEVALPAGQATVTFNVKDSEDTYTLSVEAKAGEVVEVSADDAKFVPSPAAAPAASPESSKSGDSSPQPVK